MKLAQAEMIRAFRTNDTTKVISYQQVSARKATVTLPPPYVEGHSLSTPLLLAGEKKQ